MKKVAITLVITMIFSMLSVGMVSAGILFEDTFDGTRMDIFTWADINSWTPTAEHTKLEDGKLIIGPGRGRLPQWGLVGHDYESFAFKTTVEITPVEEVEGTFHAGFDFRGIFNLTFAVKDNWISLLDCLQEYSRIEDTAIDYEFPRGETVVFDVLVVVEDISIWVKIIEDEETVAEIEWTYPDYDEEDEDAIDYVGSAKGAVNIGVWDGDGTFALRYYVLGETLEDVIDYQ